jgi:hypothetical protein
MGFRTSNLRCNLKAPRGAAGDQLLPQVLLLLL